MRGLKGGAWEQGYVVCFVCKGIVLVVVIVVHELESVVKNLRMNKSLSTSNYIGILEHQSLK